MPAIIADVLNALELRRQNERLRQELEDMRAYVRHLERPEPYRVTQVIGVNRRGTNFVLQIARQINAYPDIIVEVHLND